MSEDRLTAPTGAFAGTAAHRLAAHLQSIAAALATDPRTLALLALGSVGRETERIDAWSDLDFFVIVEPGAQGDFIARLDWLAAAAPVVWHFRNTADGNKALLADGTFCEFAVFEPGQLATIPYAPGRWVWRRDERVDAALAAPVRALPRPTTDEAWLVGELLGNLLVGLARWQRGEKLSAMRLVQVWALDRLIELDALRARAPAGVPAGDPFAIERRVEARQPALAAELPALLPGYAHTPAAAAALLAALARRGVAVPDAVRQRLAALGLPGPAP